MSLDDFKPSPDTAVEGDYVIFYNQDRRYLGHLLHFDPKFSLVLYMSGGLAGYRAHIETSILAKAVAAAA